MEDKYNSNDVDCICSSSSESDTEYWPKYQPVLAKKEHKRKQMFAEQELAKKIQFGRFFKTYHKLEQVKQLNEDDQKQYDQICCMYKKIYGNFPAHENPFNQSAFVELDLQYCQSGKGTRYIKNTIKFLKKSFEFTEMTGNEVFFEDIRSLFELSEINNVENLSKTINENTI